MIFGLLAAWTRDDAALLVTVFFLLLVGSVIWWFYQLVVGSFHRWRAYRQSPAFKEKRRQKEITRAFRQQDREWRRHEKEAKEKARLQEIEEKRKAAALQADREAARNRLLSFCSKNDAAVGSVFPADQRFAFVRAKMPDSEEPEKLWAVAEAKIGELQPIINDHRERAETLRRQEQERDQAWQQRRLMIETEIAGLREYIPQLERSPLGREINEPEIMRAQLRIQQLEQELRQLASTTLSGLKL